MADMKSKLLASSALFAVVLLMSLTSAAKQKPVKLAMKDAQGKTVGWAMVNESGKGVEIRLTLDSMPPGEHAVHIHQSASCEGPDFKSAGAHLNPENKQHGFDNPQGHHAGDMKNFTVKSDGKADVKIKDAEVNLNPAGDPNSLLSNGGTAIVVHAKPDDYKTDPSGNSGDRIACGVISR